MRLLYSATCTVELYAHPRDAGREVFSPLIAYCFRAQVLTAADCSESQRFGLHRRGTDAVLVYRSMPHQLLGQLPEDKDSPISQGFGLRNWPAEVVGEVYNALAWISLREVADDEQF